MYMHESRGPQSNGATDLRKKPLRYIFGKDSSGCLGDGDDGRRQDACVLQDQVDRLMDVGK